MKKKILYVVFAVCIFLLLYYFVRSKQDIYQNISVVCIKENCFDVELAITNQEKAEGLMFKKELPKNQGMLFIYNAEEFPSFWMKNTLINLDIIWINENLEIVDIKHNALPCTDFCESFSPKEKAKYVLEINAGISEDLGFSIRDSVILGEY